ncbi:N-acetylmuramoyl-L-alanine amidase [Tenacibaculum finnmarkense]|uniref:N-acetylmuramoyl-L-alanine amidase n=1 Tax=Tenacibaculum finnmarkense TaxID=2781243 RepID=UPI002079A84C|nr:N-acetylmuramoyl-L-alanine amidase [Tenacibaculum finnmarkense]MCM8906825.1 N-acetylmuramoyl-L-alanine amidase [Tenacibaculum finnmarkense genomovar finnmarkense]
MKVAFVIGHTKLKKGAYSDFLKKSEYDFYKGFVCELEEIGDVFEHNYLNTGYNNRQRKTAIKTKDYDVVFELHFNKFNTKANGCEALYYLSNDKSRQIAKVFCDTYSKLTRSENRGVKSLYCKKQRGYGFVKHQKTNAIILEPFFGDNKEDCSKFEINNLIKAIKKSLL